LLKLVHRVCAGIDVHKKFVEVAIGTTDEQNVTAYQTKRFGTFTDELVKLRDFLLSVNCFEVCMESTGKYWIPIFNILEDHCHVCVANPKYVRGIKGNKTDKRDALWLCDLHKHGLTRNSFIPPKDIRQLRDVMRYRVKLKNLASSEKNRAQNSLTVSNIMLSSVVSDTFGKSSRRIIDKLIENPNDTKFDIVPLMEKHMKASPEEISRSIQGTLTEPQSMKLHTCLEHISDIAGHIKTVEDAANKLAELYQRQAELLQTLPGIASKMTAIAIIGEIGVDMSVFGTSRHLSSWAGLVPANNESAGKKKSVRCARAGVYIKPLLVECAHAAVKSKKIPYFAARYNKIARRRGKKKAIIAIAHMLLVCIFHMLQRDEPFNPDLYKLDCVPGHSHQQMTAESAAKLLRKLGATVIMPNKETGESANLPTETIPDG